MRIAVAGPERTRPVADHRETLTEMASAAAGAGADLLLLPELASTGPIEIAGIREVAEPSDGPTATWLRGLASRHRLAVLGGFAEACTGRVHSSAMLVDATGVAIACYRRSHIGAEEEDHLSRGHWLTMMPLGRVQLGIVVGYDVLFPEPCRGLSLAGAELLLVLGARDPALAARSTRVLAARAQDNEVPLVCSNWSERGGPAAAAFAADGTALDGAEVPLADGRLLIVDVDVRSGARSASLRSDRRPRLYQRLAELDGVDEPARAV